MSLPEYEKQFAIAEFSGLRTPEYYKQRLEHLGFVDKGNVLDAACGMGQWTMALSELNTAVHGIDLNRGRLHTASRLIETHGKHNCCLLLGNLESLPYRISLLRPFSVTGYSCSPAWNNPHRISPDPKPRWNSVPERELCRVVPSPFPGPGYRAEKWCDGTNGSERCDTDPARKKSMIIVSGKRLRRCLGQGFRVIQMRPEGNISVRPDQEPPRSAYPPSFYGFPSVVEILAEKVK